MGNATATQEKICAGDLRPGDLLHASVSNQEAAWHVVLAGASDGGTATIETQAGIITCEDNLVLVAELTDTHRVARTMLALIAADVAAGTLPAGIESFADIGTVGHIDANQYLMEARERNGLTELPDWSVDADVAIDGEAVAYVDFRLRTTA